jgi:hypothetical protein
MRKPRTWFDEDWRLSALSKKGDPLEKLNSTIDWEIFREILEEQPSTRILQVQEDGLPLT